MIKLSIVIYTQVNIVKIDGELCEFTLLFFVYFLYFLAGQMGKGLATPWLCLCRPFLYFLRDVWIRTQSAAVASRRYQLSQPISLC
jgi:hypothetical protein